MNTVYSFLILSTAGLVACSHAVVSKTPIEVQGVGQVYRYQGRANFAHQINEADRQMTEHCMTVNGGRPVVLTQDMRDIGVGVVGGSNTNTSITGTSYTSGNQTTTTGIAKSNSFGSASALRNMNQEIMFKCVKN